MTAHTPVTARLRCFVSYRVAGREGAFFACVAVPAATADLPGACLAALRSDMQADASWVPHGLTVIEVIGAEGRA